MTFFGSTTMWEIFESSLRFRVASGDITLQKHLATASSLSTYVSKKTQNKLVKCCGDEISSKTVKMAQKARFYSMIFDETTDISHGSQLSLVLRCVREHTVREDILQFVYPRDRDSTDEPILTNRAIGETVLTMMKKNGLDTTQCVGVGTDGCTAILSELRGATTKIQQEASLATRSPCFNQVLNLPL